MNRSASLVRVAKNMLGIIRVECTAHVHSALAVDLGHVGGRHVKQSQGSWVGIPVCVCPLSLAHSLIGKRGSSGISLV